MQGWFRYSGTRNSGTWLDMANGSRSYEVYLVDHRSVLLV